MSTERNHPRDQNSSAVDAMLKDMAERVEAIGKVTEDDMLFDIPTGLIPGCDNKMLKTGLLLIYVYPDADLDKVKAHCQKITEAFGERLHSYDDTGRGHYSVSSREEERNRLRQLRTDANKDFKTAIVVRPLPHDRWSDTLEQEADTSIYFYAGVNRFYTILERGKLRRADVPKDTNRVLSL